MEKRKNGMKNKRGSGKRGREGAIKMNRSFSLSEEFASVPALNLINIIAL